MKKIFSAIAVLTMVFSLVSCGGDDEPKVYEWDNKTWNSIKTVSYDCPNEVDNYEKGLQCNETYCRKLTFNGNGTFILTVIENGVTNTYNGSYSVSNETNVYMDYSDLNIDVDTRFELIDNNTLRIHDVTDPGACKSYTEFNLDSSI
ncbi:hypothetical protein OO013_07975 [Mangrovivirga sp. M17]|uniref:Lipocalin-like domain-containing protein n=1 Tax=Mangrovivirga halotolerans TaxID=2993936 RepID=A0ABT3RPS5_9BACT|nr:hypothetical protein [Mangrovivirga halotolerans]MCX2743798.1 hypothetical protein [Mangrovivirga halotolerans]